MPWATGGLKERMKEFKRLIFAFEVYGRPVAGGVAANRRSGAERAGSRQNAVGMWGVELELNQEEIATSRGRGGEIPLRKCDDREPIALTVLLSFLESIGQSRCRFPSSNWQLDSAAKAQKIGARIAKLRANIRSAERFWARPCFELRY
jgi:hypothetical protein